MNSRGSGSPRLSRRLPLVGATLMAVLGVAASACSGGHSTASPPADPHKAVLAAVQTTESASSAAITISLSVTGTLSLGGVTSTTSAAIAPAISLDINGKGLFSFANKTGEMTLDIPSLGQGTAGTIQFREIDGNLYLDTASLTSLDGGKPWIELNLAQFEQAESQSTNPLASLADGDPTQILSLLKDLGGTVMQVGTTDIDGVPTTEYAGQIDLAGSGKSPSLLSPQLAQTLGLSSIPVDVWVDDEGRARQVETSFTVLGLDIKAQAQIGSFGAPVSVSPPPADQVANGNSLLQGGQVGSLFGLG